MRVRLDMSVPREMFSYRGHARESQPGRQTVREFRDRCRGAVEGAVPDDATLAIVDVQHRRKAEVHAGGAQFRSQYVTCLLRQVPGLGRMFIPDIAQFAHGREPGETITKALYSAALVIHRDEQRGGSQRMYLRSQLVELRERGVIAREQNHTAH